jgi:hypothetical protein
MCLKPIHVREAKSYNQGNLNSLDTIFGVKLVTSFKMKTLFTFLFITILSLNTQARNCPQESNLGIDALQGLISFSEENIDSKSYKKINDSETIFVPKLTEELFLSIKQDPQKIAEIFGAKLVEERGPNEFRLAINLIGFDFAFDVKTKDLPNHSIQIELQNFNTFFHSGSATLNIVSFDEKGATLSVKGHALVPKTPANIFSISLGGEKNLKKLLQTEIDSQLLKAVERFEKKY